MMKKFSKHKRKKILKRRVRRIEDMATGRVKGLTEKQFRRELRRKAKT